MDSGLCNNIVNIPPLSIFLVVAVLLGFVFIQKYLKFREEMQEYEILKNKRKDVVEEIVEIEIPDYNRFLITEIILALLAFGTALLGFLSSDNISYSFTVNQTCIVSQQIIITVEGTIYPSATPLATEIATDVATPTLTATNTGMPTNTATNTATPTNTATETAIPSATPFQQYYSIPLVDGTFWGVEGNLGLTAIDGAVGVAIRELLDIPFEVGRDISTFGCAAGITNTIDLDTTVPSPINAYFLIQAGNAYIEYDGLNLGYLQLVFSGGSELTQSLILGDNIRDWSRNLSSAVTTITSEQTREAWRGFAQGREGGMDVITMAIPESYQDATLVGIEISDTSNFSVNDPCIHLQAVTVESN